MMSKKVFWCLMSGLLLCAFMVPDTCIANMGNGMQILETNIPVACTRRHQYYPAFNYNPIDKEYMVVWWESGRRVEEDTVSYHSITGQRVSPDGDLIGEIFDIGDKKRGQRGCPKIRFL